MAEGEDFTFFAVKDVLTSKLAHLSTAVNYTGADPSHYTISGLNNGPVETNAEVLVKFTRVGPAHLKTIQGQSVSVSITTKVIAAGEIENKADIYDRDPGSWSESGNIEISPLSVSQLSRTCSQLTAAPTLLSRVPGLNCGGAKGHIRQHCSESDGWRQTRGHHHEANGHARFSTPVRVSNFSNGKATEPGQSGHLHFLLKELRAPTGYELLAEPLRFELRADSASYTDESGVEIFTATVETVEKGGGFRPPFTGGTGTVLFVVVGALPLAGTAAMLASCSRRRNQS